MNSRANEYARANAAAAEVEVEFVQSDRLPSGTDLVIANPPYMMDPRSRAYRDGGQLLGGAVALDWVRQALANMTRGGQILLYTGVAYVDGGSPLVATLEEECRSAGAQMIVEEIDPDVFGEELDEAAYRTVERIAAVGISISLQG
jgi:methylase of polypeptide subunit release factors